MRSFEQWFPIDSDVVDIVAVVIKLVLVLALGPEDVDEHEDGGEHEDRERHYLQAVSADSGEVTGHGRRDLVHRW